VLNFVFLILFIADISGAGEYKTQQARSPEFSNLFKEQLEATAAIIQEFQFHQIPGSFNSSYRTCRPSGFLNDVLWSNCSGVLVSEDLVLTAAHCANQTNCADLTFAFDFLSNQDVEKIQRDDRKQYKCKQIVYSRYSQDKSTPFDLALVQLDRRVLDRKPVKLQSTELRVGEKVFALGHPLGSPLKIQEGFVPTTWSNKTSHQKISMAAHAGLSGSGVYNKKGEILGLLVRGGPTFEHDGICTREIKCDDEGCPWADLQVIPTFKSLYFEKTKPVSSEE